MRLPRRTLAMLLVAPLSAGAAVTNAIVVHANPRYTGYQVWKRQRRDEVLLDIDDVAAGHVSRMRWNPRDQWVYSAAPTHEALVSREVFDQVQARIAARSSTSPRAAATSRRPYALRGRLTCGRRLQGQWVRGEACCRCRYPSEYAQSAGFDHPTNVYLREADLLPKLDAWLSRLVSPANIDATCRRLAIVHTHPVGNRDGRCGQPSMSWPTASASLPATGGAGGRRRPDRYQPVDCRNHAATA